MELENGSNGTGMAKQGEKDIIVVEWWWPLPAMTIHAVTLILWIGVV